MIRANAQAHSITSSTTTVTSTTAQVHSFQHGCERDTLAELLQNGSSTCAKTLDEHQRCALVCPRDYQSVGYFTCSHGVFVGQSRCELRQLGSSVTVSAKVAATMEVQVEFLREVPHAVSVQLLK